VLVCASLTSGCGVSPWQQEVVSEGRVEEQRADFAQRLNVLAERDARSVQLRLVQEQRCTVRSKKIVRDTLHESRSLTPVFYVEVMLLLGAFATPWWYGDEQEAEGGPLLLTLILVAPTMTAVMIDASASKQRRSTTSRVVDRSLRVGELCGREPLSDVAIELKFSDGFSRRVRTDEDGYVRVPVWPNLVVDVVYDGRVIQRVDIYAPELEPEAPASESPSGYPGSGAEEPK